MKTKFFEGTDQFNYGKFMLGAMSLDELNTPCLETTGGVNQFIHNTESKFWILDLQTKEGAFFDLKFDIIPQLEKHQIWVCPMYPLFLERCANLYKVDSNFLAWDQVQNFEQGSHNALHRPRQEINN